MAPWHRSTIDSENFNPFPTCLEGGDLCYLRTLSGTEREGDFVLETGGRVVTIEIKASSKTDFKGADAMLQLKDLLPGWSRGIVVTNGAEVQKSGSHLYAMPAAMM